MSTKPTAPATNNIRSSASVVIVNLRNEILLVQRNPKTQAFGGFHVFPGGNFDASQDDTLSMTAIRETFEESGILLASPPTSSSLPPLNDEVLKEARRLVHTQQLSFCTFLEQHELTPSVSALLPFTQWVTPVDAPRRFRTQFYVTFLPATFPSEFPTDDEAHIPISDDDGQEVISARFVHPEDAIAEFRDDRISIMPPQFYILSTLANVLRTRKNSIAQRETVRTLSGGAFGRMAINPKWMPAPSDRDGRKVLVYEGDEAHGGSKGRFHRALVRFGKGRIITKITLLRNFDIFSEIEEHAFRDSGQTKL